MNNIMDQVLTFNNQTSRKDRIFRLIQYGSRLCWWLCEKLKADKDLISKLKNLEYSLSTGRRLLRLGRSLEGFHASLKTVHLPDLVLRITLTMAKINYALYLVADHIIWLNQTGLVKLNKEKWSTIANKFWLFSIVMQLARDVYEIQHLINIKREVSEHNSMLSSSGTCSDSDIRCSLHRQRSRQTTQFSYPFSVWPCEHKDIILDTMKNTFDLVIPVSGINSNCVSPGFVGLCGTLSSMIGIYLMNNPSLSIKPN